MEDGDWEVLILSPLAFVCNLFVRVVYLCVGWKCGGVASASNHKRAGLGSTPGAEKETADAQLYHVNRSFVCVLFVCFL